MSSSGVVYFWLVISTAQLPRAEQHQYQPKNPGCLVAATATVVCDETYQWQDVAIRCERAYDKLVIDKAAVDAKLKNHLEPPPPTVIVESEIPTWLLVVGSFVVAGAFIGGAYTALQVSK